MEKRGADPRLGKPRLREGVIFARPGFPHGLDPQPGIEEHPQPTLERTMDLMKGKSQPVALYLVERPLNIEVAPLMAAVANELRRGERMRERCHQPAVADQHAGRGGRRWAPRRVQSGSTGQSSSSIRGRTSGATATSTDESCGCS